jgi:hypothetical protein
MSSSERAPIPVGIKPLVLELCFRALQLLCRPASSVPFRTVISCAQLDSWQEVLLSWSSEQKGARPGFAMIEEDLEWENSMDGLPFYRLLVFLSAACLSMTSHLSMARNCLPFYDLLHFYEPLAFLWIACLSMSRLAFYEPQVFL